jgi:hypothetical protein
VLSHVVKLGPIEWDVWDFVTGRTGATLGEISARFGANAARAQASLRALHEARLVFQWGERANFHIAQISDESELYVLMTEGCNLACAGCATSSDVIAPGEAATLSYETASLFLESYARSCAEKGIRTARIKWAGGEPYLKKPYRVITRCAELIASLRARYPDIRIEQTLLTNGTLLDGDRVAFAREHDIHVSVSLWGTEGYQDRVRLPRDRRETFARVVDSIRRLRRAGVRYNVNYVLTPENAADYADFLTFAWDSGSPSFVARDWEQRDPLPIYTAFFRPQRSSLLRDQQYDAMIGGLRAGSARVLDMIRRGIRVPPLNSIDYLDLFKTILTPCGSGFTYVAVGPKGAASCHEGLYQMEDNLRRIAGGENLFDVVNGEYAADRALLLGPNITYLEGDQLALHGGQGCPRLARAENGGKLGKASSSTRLYNAIYKEMLSLETMRQLTLARRGEGATAAA